MLTSAPTADIEALDALSQRLMAAFARAGYERIALPVIQPADLFLDLVGESLRARTYVFVDPDGAELCLRPDLTVPTCRLHLERHPGANVAARYCYSGRAFRYQPSGADRTHPREFHQAGIESFAASDRERDDAAVLALTVAALREAGLRDMRLQLGDLGLFAALINALPMPERWRSRLRHQLPQPEAFRTELARLATGPEREGDALEDLLGRLDGADPARAEALVVEHLDQAGIELMGTRSAGEIAQRLLAEAADRRARPLPAATAALIEAYVALKAPAREAVAQVDKLARCYGVDLSAGLKAFARRLDLIEEAGVSIAEAQFSAEFGRNLDYYTGFVFEVISPALGPRSPVAGGGRYDNLLAEAGAPVSVPAVGASIHTERLLAAVQETSGNGHQTSSFASRPATSPTPTPETRHPHTNGKLILALPSKGRLLEQTNALLARVGLAVTKPAGAARGYKAEIDGLPGVEVNLVSASEIAQLLRSGAVHLGVTGEDLIRETMADADDRVRFIKPLGFGHADVVVAVPDCWLDVRRMADLERMAVLFRRLHGHRMRVATKYTGLTRRAFSEMGVTGYRIVESLGATEGAPAAGLAELIVDITTTGATLKANGLRVLDDGVILRSQATLIASKAASWTPELAALEARIEARLRGGA